MKQKKVQKGMSKFLSEIDLRYQVDCCWLGNFDIDFFSPLPSPKFWNSETVNMNQNVGVNFQKQKWKLTKYIKTEWKQSIIPRNFSSADAYEHVGYIFVTTQVALWSHPFYLLNGWVINVVHVRSGWFVNKYCCRESIFYALCLRDGWCQSLIY